MLHVEQLRPCHSVQALESCMHAIQVSLGNVSCLSTFTYDTSVALSVLFGAGNSMRGLLCCRGACSNQAGRAAGFAPGQCCANQRSQEASAAKQHRCGHCLCLEPLLTHANFTARPPLSKELPLLPNREQHCGRCVIIWLLLPNISESSRLKLTPGCLFQHGFT